MAANRCWPARRLSSTYCSPFALRWDATKYRVRVGISLEGPPVANDRHRVYADGRGSHSEVARALNRLVSQRFRHLYGGILCTVDLRNDPLEVYEHLLSFEPPEIDFLLPHGN